MRTRNPSRNGFTLLEMVVVLAVLAVVTTLAMRSLDHVQDQQRDDANRRGFEELRDAILGNPEDRASDGTHTINGFVADMGRLPRAVEIDGNLTLAELWMRPNSIATFGVRPATEEHGVPLEFEDPQVLVQGGWRGPYLRLPLGASQYADGWGNPMVTPLSAGSLKPDAEGYARLRHQNGDALTAEGQEIRRIWHLGANGTSSGTDTGYDKDGYLEFDDAACKASLTAQIEVMNGDDPETLDSTHQVTICAFSPNPADPSKIQVSNSRIVFDSNPIVLPALTGLTQGARVVRAYYHPAASPPNSSRKSSVKNITLRPGANFVELKIDR